MLFATTELFDQCISIDEMGTYILATDIEYGGEDSCIKITANSVTIDCDGHTILGGYPGTAILVKKDAKNIHITNCNIGFFEYGVYAEENVGNIRMEGLKIDSCKEGVSLHEGRDADMLECSFTNNNIAVRLDSWLRGTINNSYFSNRDYGVFLTSTTEYTIASSEFTNSVYGVYTEGLCDGTKVSNSEFHTLVTPIDLYGTSATIDGNTFYNNAGYAILIRESMNSFENNAIYGQPLFFATQSNAFTFVNLAIGELGQVGSINFREFAAPKPFTTTRFYYFNDTNVIIEPDFISVTSEHYSSLILEDVTIWLEDPNVENETAVFQADEKCTSRSQVLLEGTALKEPIPEESSPGVLSFKIEDFTGSYALGERPPETEAERYVIIIILDGPSEAEANSTILIETRDQNAELLPRTLIYYYTDALNPTYVGATEADGTLGFFIPEEGTYVIEAKYNNISSQRAINIIAPEEPEPDVAELPGPELDYATEIPEPELTFEPEEAAAAPAEPPEAKEEDFPVALALGILAGVAIIAIAAWLIAFRKPPKRISHGDSKHAVHERMKKFRKD